MNKEQKDLVLEHINFAKYLSKKISTRFHLTKSTQEECENIALCELCECAARYNENKGMFRPYAAKCIRMNIWRFLCTDFHSGIKPPQHIGNDEFAATAKVYRLEDMDECMAQEDEISLLEKIIDFRRSLQPRERKFFDNYVTGLESSSIADKMGISKQTAQKYCYETKKKMRVILLNES